MIEAELPRIERVAHHLARRMNPNGCMDWEDLRQEAALERLRGRQHIDGPMLDVMRHAMRWRLNVKHTSLEDWKAKLSKSWSNAPAVLMEDRWNAAVDTEKLLATTKLTAREYSVITMIYIQEIKQNEISRILGVNESRVSQLRRAALIKLRERVEGKNE